MKLESYTPYDVTPFPPHIICGETLAISDKAQSHLANAAAILMVPPEEFDPVLQPEELQMRFGEPVIHMGSNYSLMATQYKQAIHGDPRDKVFKKWDAVPLSTYLQNAECHTMAYCHRLLVLTDRLRKQGATAKEAFEFLRDHHGYDKTERTLRRQTAHARLGLVLAASGQIDSLPSQNVAGIISARLARRWWAGFLSISKIKEGLPNKVQRALQDYSYRYNVPLRGEPINSVHRRKTFLPPLPDDRVAQDSILEVPASTEGEANAQKKIQNQKKKQPKNFLAPLLANELQGRVPNYHFQDPPAFSKAFLEELDKGTSSVPRPARHKQLDEIADAMARIDPVRAEMVATAALRAFYWAIIDKTTQTAGYPSGKKLPADTPCPNSKPDSDE